MKTLRKKGIEGNFFNWVKDITKQSYSKGETFKSLPV